MNFENKFIFEGSQNHLLGHVMRPFNFTQMSKCNVHAGMYILSGNVTKLAQKSILLFLHLQGKIEGFSGELYWDRIGGQGAVYTKNTYTCRSMFSPQVGHENRVMDVDDEKIQDIPDQ